MCSSQTNLRRVCWSPCVNLRWVRLNLCSVANRLVRPSLWPLTLSDPVTNPEVELTLVLSGASSVYATECHKAAHKWHTLPAMTNRCRTRCA